MKKRANANEPASLSFRAAAGILAITGSIDGVPAGVAVVGDADVVVVAAADVTEGVVGAGAGSPPVQAPNVATATRAAAYGSSLRCR